MTGTATAATGALWRLPAVRSLLAVTVLGFLSYSLLLSALPAHAAAGGAGLSAAGSVTTVFLVLTVLVQFAVPRLLGRLGLRVVLTGGLLALGLPAPLYLAGNDVRWFAVVSALRGVGFAVLTVLGSTIAARAVPPERRGESIGLYGLAIALPMLVAVPAGAALTSAGAFGWVAVLAVAPVPAVAFVPALVRALGPGSSGGEGSQRSAVRAAVPPSLVLLVVTLAGGGLLTFLPIEHPDGAVAPVALFLLGVGSAASRWRAGVLADRIGTRVLLPGSVVAGAGGLLLVALGLLTGGRGGIAALLAGALLFGGSYGAVQNLSLLVALARAGEGRTATVSAVWNACYDCGTAIGALAVGVVASAGVGLPGSYLLVAAVLVLVLPLAVTLPRGPRSRG